VGSGLEVGSSGPEEEEDKKGRVWAQGQEWAGLGLGLVEDKWVGTWALER